MNIIYKYIYCLLHRNMRLYSDDKVPYWKTLLQLTVFGLTYFAMVLMLITPDWIGFMFAHPFIMILSTIMCYLFFLLVFPKPKLLDVGSTMNDNDIMLGELCYFIHIISTLLLFIFIMFYKHYI